MYTDRNFKSKKALKEAVAKGEEVTYYQPGPFGGQAPRDGTIFIEGPHYPMPHKFYCECLVKDGKIIKVK